MRKTELLDAVTKSIGSPYQRIYDYFGAMILSPSDRELCEIDMMETTDYWKRLELRYDMHEGD